MELANLNGVWRQLESSSVEVNATRNRFVRSASEKGSASSDYIVEPNYKNPYSSGGRNESQQRLMLLRSNHVVANSSLMREKKQKRMLWYSVQFVKTATDNI
ncbi:hypothetical protein F8388_020187 [Cannabis sativa]|uniref:Uncharacterized protein n=1 Tax=Cannabis sativa TaxID=3483 RepID=A0A7J6FIR1_CANSA|nr:hypothetical protein F8388_020187 [Cannabis sativa]